MKKGTCWGCQQVKKIRQVVLFKDADPVWLCKKCEVSVKFEDVCMKEG